MPLLAKRNTRCASLIVVIKCFCATNHCTMFALVLPTRRHTSLCARFCIYRKVYNLSYSLFLMDNA